MATEGTQTEFVIQLNGEARRLPVGTTVATLLSELELASRVAVARNREVVPRSSYASTTLAAGDRVEILEAVGGG
ncbi:MAG: sulfur carrier protein ThiS [Proteobacteria bacterium]|nr:sulfur carrier protein ThiS [Pseudomonadota bacterium]